MERPLAPDELADYVCPHLCPLVAALQQAGYRPSLAVFDIKAHILSLEYPSAARSLLAASGQSEATQGLECSADSVVCRRCTQSLALV